MPVKASSIKQFLLHSPGSTHPSGLAVPPPPSSKAAVQTSARITFLQVVIPSPNCKNISLLTSLCVSSEVWALV